MGPHGTNDNRLPHVVLMAADADITGLTARLHAISIRSSDHEPHRPLEEPLERSNPSNRSFPGQTGRRKSRRNSHGEYLQSRFNCFFPFKLGNPPIKSDNGILMGLRTIVPMGKFPDF
jgi:hypothetical protein